MAFRAEKRIGAFLSGLLLSSALFAQQTFYYQVRKGADRGVLTINQKGVSFQETYEGGKMPKHPDALHWNYQDIQQLKISAKSLSLITYRDSKWKLGADREYEFDLVWGTTFEKSYAFLKTRLDERFVAELAERPGGLLWEIPVKHLRRFGGDQGVLRAGTEGIVYSSDDKDASRTWRFQDIDNISSSGPFQLTITTFEKAKLDYGDRKQFNFQLKQRLTEARYNDLWLRVNHSKGLKALNSYR
jgi:hypothetical protein